MFRLSGLQPLVVGYWLVSSTLLGALPAAGYQREMQTAANEVGEKLGTTAKRSVAVVDFTDLQGNATELGRFLAEELSVALASGTRPVEVVDRTHLKILLQEHKLSATGVIDPATAKKLGQIAGVDALVTGTLTPFGDTVRLTLKVLDTSSARIVAATTVEIAKTKAIEELVTRELGGSGAPAQSATMRATSAATVAMPAPVENGGLRFTLRRCSYSGGGVRCELMIENLTENSASLSLYGTSSSRTSSSYLYDTAGNQYHPAAVSLGTGETSNYRASQEIIPGIPLAARITFSGVPSDLKQGSLSLAFEANESRRRVGGFGGVSQGSFPVVFRDIPIT